MNNNETILRKENLVIDTEAQQNSAEQLVKRILPDHYKFFDLKISNDVSEDYFIIKDAGEKISLEANNPVSIASALNWYLKYYCNCHISWNGNQLNLPGTLPKVGKTISHKAAFDLRYYLNYCTFSYSMVWWDWERWEKEIDWMALNGINITLALIGQEAVWQNALRRLGVKEENIFKFLPGPAFLAWGWLGNFDGWGGPTTQNWINDQKELQFKILARLRELNITPILQAFIGRVPECLKKKFPEAKIDQLPGWYGYEGVYFLDPSDPLFKKLNKIFIEEQTKLYGNDHYFAGDVFHEIESPLTGGDYLSSIYKGIQEGLLYADNKAKWVLQSWTIRDENIDALDENHVIILDLYCDSEPKWKKTNAFHGHPWVWCIINNFGGRTGLGGRLKHVAKELNKAVKSDEKGKLIGVGLAPEGIGNNAVLYDMLTEMNWNNEIENVDEWVTNFSKRRYGIESENTKNAWLKLLDSVYTGPKAYPPLESVICALPSLEINKAGSNGCTELYYDNSILIESFESLTKEIRKLSGEITFVHDCVDITRQIGANTANIIYEKIVVAYKSKNVESFKKLTGLFLNIINDLDEVLNSRESFSLSKWINDSKRKAKNEEDLKLYEWNARRQITLWSSPEIGEFHDYANKQWGGLLRDYYLPRWENFFVRLNGSLENSHDFNQDEFRNDMLKFAVEWSDKKELPKNGKQPDSIELAVKFVDRYKNIIESLQLMI